MTCCGFSGICHRDVLTWFCPVFKPDGLCAWGGFNFLQGVRDGAKSNGFWCW